MAEGNGLLNRRTGNACTAGSNPALSVKRAPSYLGGAFFLSCGMRNRMLRQQQRRGVDDQRSAGAAKRIPLSPVKKSPVLV